MYRHTKNIRENLKPHGAVLTVIVFALSSIVSWLPITPVHALKDGKPHVYILGDSITVRSTDDLNEAFESQGQALTIDAEVGRGLVPTGIDILNNSTDTLRSAEVVVIALGTNNPGAASEERIAEAIQIVKSANGSAKIFWTNVSQSDQIPGAVEFNQRLTKVASEQGITVLDWHTASSGKLDGDGIHPNFEEGVPAFANLIGTAAGVAATGATSQNNDVVSQEENNTDAALRGSVYYDPNDTISANATCSVDLSGADEEIIAASILTNVGANQSIYQEVEEETGVPWEMLATLHTLETGASRTNPANPDGPYQMDPPDAAITRVQQILASNGITSGTEYTNPFQPGLQTSDALFKAMTQQAAEFFIGKAQAVGVELNGDSTSEHAIKYTFFAYNGLAQLYRNQAAQLGYDPEGEGYEGSPYVMNRVGDARKSELNPNWRQIKGRVNGNLIIEPANKGPGAWLVYTQLANVSAAGSNCSGSLSGVSIDGLTCPSTLKEHPNHPGYYEMPEAPNGEYIITASQVRRYGALGLVCALYTVGLAYHEYAQTNNLHSIFRVGDLNAGKPHETHNQGHANDNNAKPFGEGTGEKTYAATTDLNAGPGTYSAEATATLGKMFVDAGRALQESQGNGSLRNIWWCPPGGENPDTIATIRSYAEEQGVPITGLRCIDGHHNHFHVDFNIPPLQVWTP